MLCLSLSGSVSLLVSVLVSASVSLSVYSPPSHMVRQRNFIFGVNMNTCPELADLKNQPIGSSCITHIFPFCGCFKVQKKLVLTLLVGIW